MKNRKAQVAIWIILAILLVVSIIIFALLNRKPGLTNQDILNPKAYIEKCARQSVNDALDPILEQGGFINPENYKLYNGIKATYLCENIGNYEPCINQHPLLLNEIKKEIYSYVKPRIDQCFSQLKDSYEKRGYDISLGNMTLDVSLGPSRVFVDIDKVFVITSGEEVNRYETFKAEVVSSVYDIGSVAMEIASQQAKYCYFEYVGYMILYPRFLIEVYSMSDSTKIYTIQDKYSNEKMNIAIRSCAIPPGI